MGKRRRVGRWPRVGTGRDLRPLGAAEEVPGSKAGRTGVAVRRGEYA